MKKKVFKRAMAYVCAITMLVATMADVRLVNVKADTVTTKIAKNAPERPALIAEIQNADYNFALNKEAEVSNLTTAQGGTDLSIITNGKFEIGNSAATTIEIGQGSTDPTWMEVDLGEAYDSTAIDRVVAQYRTAASGPKTEYFIQFSLNGKDWVDVAQVNNVASGDNQIYLDDITLTDEQKAAMPFTKYVRIYSTTNSSAYGLMTKGMAVLTDGTTKVSEVETKELEKLANPVSLTVTSSDYSQLEYSFEAAEGHDDYEYVAYVNGVSKGTVLPGETYVVTDLASGTYTVKIVSNKDGLKSDGITEEVSVQDSKPLIEDERNIAVGKSVDVSSIRQDAGNDPDIPANLTDGNLTSIFRFVAADTKATAVIDLGDYYKPDILDRAILLFTAGRYTKDYTIDYSLNGITFTTVAEGKGTKELQDTKIDASAYGLEAVRYVRFSLANPVAPQGFQLYELALIAKEDADMTPVEVETLDNPASLTVTSSDYGQLEYVFEAAEGHDDYEYVAFVNGANQGTVIPGEKYVIKDLLTGTYTIKVASVKGDLGSSGLVESVDVNDVRTLLTSERNAAVGKPATSNSIRVTHDPDYPDDPAYDVYDDPVKLTDGNITTVFRTLETDLTAEFIIDLEKDYKPTAFERMVMLFNAKRYAKAYTVEFSATGEDGTYEQVAEVVEQAGDFTTTEFDVSAYTGETVRFVKINLSDAVEPNYGFQCLEIAMVENFIDIADTNITTDEEAFYTGAEITPEVKAEYDGNTLVQDKDYTVEYAENTAVGTAKITVAGMGRFNGAVEKTFTIKKQQMANCFVNVEFDEENNLAVTAKNGELELAEGTDFEYAATVDEDGNVVVTVTGKGDNYEGETTRTIALADLPLNEVTDLTVTSDAVNEIAVVFAAPDKVGASNQVYNIYIDEELADEKVAAGEYKYTEQTAGTHTVKVVAVLGDKTSDGVTAEVKVAGKDLAAEEVQVLKGDIAPEYSGNACTIPITVKYGDVTLTEGTDYTIEYTDNVNAGTAKFKIVGKGLYEGTAEGTFIIAAKELKATDIKAEVNSKGEAVVTVTDGAKVLVKGTDYNCTITKETKDFKVTVTGIGNYRGTHNLSIIVEPAKPAPLKVKAPARAKIAKVTSKKKSAKTVKLSLKKVRRAKGYEVRVTTAKKAKKALVKKTVKKLKVTIKSKKLKGKKKLYVSARAYVRNAKGKKVYGKWSVAKKVRIK